MQEFDKLEHIHTRLLMNFTKGKLRREDPDSLDSNMPASPNRRNKNTKDSFQIKYKRNNTDKKEELNPLNELGGKMHNDSADSYGRDFMKFVNNIKLLNQRTHKRYETKPKSVENKRKSSKNNNRNSICQELPPKIECIVKRFRKPTPLQTYLKTSQFRGHVNVNEYHTQPEQSSGNQAMARLVKLQNLVKSFENPASVYLFEPEHKFVHSKQFIDR